MAIRERLVGIDTLKFQQEENMKDAQHFLRFLDASYKPDVNPPDGLCSIRVAILVTYGNLDVALDPHHVRDYLRRMKNALPLVRKRARGDALTLREKIELLYKSIYKDADTVDSTRMRGQLHPTISTIPAWLNEVEINALIRFAANAQPLGLVGVRKATIGLGLAERGYVLEDDPGDEIYVLPVHHPDLHLKPGDDLGTWGGIRKMKWGEFCKLKSEIRDLCVLAQHGPIPTDQEKEVMIAFGKSHLLACKANQGLARDIVATIHVQAGPKPYVTLKIKDELRSSDPRLQPLEPIHVDYGVGYWFPRGHPPRVWPLTMTALRAHFAGLIPSIHTLTCRDLTALIPAYARAMQMKKSAPKPAPKPVLKVEIEKEDLKVEKDKIDEEAETKKDAEPLNSGPHFRACRDRRITFDFHLFTSPRRCLGSRSRLVRTIFAISDFHFLCAALCC
jgi:hypothetical protein